MSVHIHRFFGCWALPLAAATQNGRLQHVTGKKSNSCYVRVNQFHEFVYSLRRHSHQELPRSQSQRRHRPLVSHLGGLPPTKLGKL